MLSLHILLDTSVIHGAGQSVCWNPNSERSDSQPQRAAERKCLCRAPALAALTPSINWVRLTKLLGSRNWACPEQCTTEASHRDRQLEEEHLITQFHNTPLITSTGTICMKVLYSLQRGFWDLTQIFADGSTVTQLLFIYWRLERRDRTRMFHGIEAYISYRWFFQMQHLSNTGRYAERDLACQDKASSAPYFDITSGFSSSASQEKDGSWFRYEGKHRKLKEICMCLFKPPCMQCLLWNWQSCRCCCSLPVHLA